MPTSETQSVQRAIAILDCFRTGQPELGVREIARQLELHPSTVGRILSTLASSGVLIQDQDTHRYRMGSKTLKWAAMYTGSVELRVEALPYMQELHRATRETISLYVPDGDARLCIERLESPQTVRMVARVGERMPYHAGASGKALLAYMPREQQEAHLSSVRFAPLTANTPHDPAALRQELAEIRAKGYATSHGERVEGASSVAAPVFDALDNAVGTLNISGPSTRFSQAKIREYARLLLEVTRRLSAALGHEAPEVTA